MIHFRRFFWFVLGLFAVLLLFYLRFQDSGILRVLAIVAGMLIGSYVWTILSLSGLNVERTIRSNRFQVGNVFEERFEIFNRLPLLRIWLEIQDEGSLKYHAGSRVISWIGPRQHRSYIARTRLFERGSYVLGPTRIISGDPFGLFETSKVIPGQKIILVLPHFSPLDRFAEPAGLLAGGKAQRRKTLEVTPYAAGVREYAPGDPLSRIHWRSTARRSRLMVKEFEQDQFSNVWIFLDAERFVNYRDPDYKMPGRDDHFWLGKGTRQIRLPDDTFEYAISAAASVADYYLRLGKSVGFACAGRASTVINPERGERQLAKLLSELAFMDALGELPLQGLLQGQLPNVPRGSIVVLVTPSYGDRLNIALVEVMKRNLSPVVISVDASSFGAAIGRSAPSLDLVSRAAPLYTLRKGSEIKTVLEE